MSKIERRQDERRLEFWLGNTHVGHVYATFHPTIPYEVFVLPSLDSKRVVSIEEAEEWILKTLWTETQ